MTRRELLVCWIVACLSTLGACLFLLRVPLIEEVPKIPDGIQTVFIGSSLTGRGIPFSAPNKPMASAEHVSWIVSGINEFQTLALAEEAIAQGADRVFVEFSAFARAQDPLANAPPSGLARDLTIALNAFTEHLNKGLAMLSGRKLASVWITPKRPASDPQWLEDRHIDLPPFKLTGPQYPERLSALPEMADEAGAKLVFFEPPRSESVVKLFEESSGDWYGHAEHVAKMHGIELVTFGASLPDEYFDDPTHLNEKGREVFSLRFSEKFGVFE